MEKKSKVKVVVTSCPICLKTYDNMYGNTLYTTKEFTDVGAKVICQECFDKYLKRHVKELGLDPDKDYGLI